MLSESALLLTRISPPPPEETTPLGYMVGALTSHQVKLLVKELAKKSPGVVYVISEIAKKVIADKLYTTPARLFSYMVMLMGKTTRHDGYQELCTILDLLKGTI